jgi:hypothetical protein
MFNTEKNRNIKKQLDNINKKFVDNQKKQLEIPEPFEGIKPPKGRYQPYFDGGAMPKKMNKKMMDEKMEGGMAWLPILMSALIPAIVPIVVDVAKKIIGSGKMKGGAMMGEAMYDKTGGSQYLGAIGSAMPSKSRKKGGQFIQLVKDRLTSNEMPSSSMSGGMCECESDDMLIIGSAKKFKAKKQNNKMNKRAQLVKKVMKERRVKLGEASRIIKEEGLG